MKIVPHVNNNPSATLVCTNKDLTMNGQELIKLHIIRTVRKHKLICRLRGVKINEDVIYGDFFEIGKIGDVDIDFGIGLNIFYQISIGVVPMSYVWDKVDLDKIVHLSWVLFDWRLLID